MKTRNEAVSELFKAYADNIRKSEDAKYEYQAISFQSRAEGIKEALLKAFNVSVIFDSKKGEFVMNDMEAESSFETLVDNITPALMNARATAKRLYDDLKEEFNNLSDKDCDKYFSFYVNRMDTMNSLASCFDEALKEIDYAKEVYDGTG